MQELGVAFAEIHRHEPHVAADPVLRMDDRVAHLQLGQIAHHRVDVARLFLAAAPRAAAARAAPEIDTVGMLPYGVAIAIGTLGVLFAAAA